MPLDPIAAAQTLIRCPSVTPEEGGALDALQAMLEPLGFRCRRHVFSAPNTPDVDNLYARYGTGKPNICFAGHTDVVPVGDAKAWTADPFGAEIKGEYLYGRGAEDMKSAIAAFAAAASRVIEDGKVTGSISLLITGDEEGPAINGTKKLLEAITKAGETIDFCLVGEPTNPTFLGEMAKIGRRGSLGGWLTVTGKQGHVAYPRLAQNPVTHLVNILHRLKAKPLDDGTEHFQPSNLEVTTVDVGNPADNVIPAQAKARFNIRFNDRWTAASLMEWIDARCREEGCVYALDLRCSAEPFITLPGAWSDRVVKAVKKVTGKAPELSTTGGTSDARFIKDYCPVVEFGTTGLTSHMVDERVKVEDVRKLAEIYYQLLIS